MLIFLSYFVSFIILLLHQSQHVFGGDSAEFSLVAKTWSIPHPPGYPFYSLLINIVDKIIPFGTTPWKIATVSSLSTVITSYLIYVILKKLNIRSIIALFSSLFYIILFPIWQYSEIPEVFALHNLLVIGITFFILLFEEQRKTLYLYAAAFLFGLCLAHHHIFVLFIPGWIYLLLNYVKKKGFAVVFNKRSLLSCCILCLIGFSFYLYAPIASYFSPPLDWENAKTVEGFFRLITRSTYGTFKAYAGSSGNLLNQLYDIVSLFIFVFLDFKLIGVVLIGIGIKAAIQKKIRFYRFLFITLLLHVFFLFYSNFSLTIPFTLAMYERFLIPLYLILIFFLAQGLESICIYLQAITKRFIKHPVLKKIVLLLPIVFMLMYFILVAKINYETIHQIPNMDIFATYAKNLLNTPPKNTIFFVGADNSHFSTLYYHFGEGYRKDLKYVFINLLDREHYRIKAQKEFPRLIMPNANSKSKILDFVALNKTEQMYFENSYGASWKPYGLLWKSYDNEEQAISDSAHLVEENTSLWKKVYTIPQLTDALKKILHLNVVQGQYLNAYFNYGRLLFATNNIDEARNAIQTILEYQKESIRTKFILVNLYLYENNCAQAQKVVSLFTLDRLLNEPDILPSLKDYYRLCQPDLKKIIQKIENQEQKMKTPISDL